MKKNPTSKYGFSNSRFLFAFALCSVGVLLALLGLGVYPGASALAQGPKQNQSSSNVRVVASYHNDTSPPLREMKRLPIGSGHGPAHEANKNPKIPPHHNDRPDEALQDPAISLRGLQSPSIPGPILNFDGIPFPGVACNCAPPDTNGEVGLTQYVQIVNKGFKVFDKATGSPVFGPVDIATLWSGFGGPCQTAGDGDPIVLYDQIADRWIISQFADNGVTVTDECVAVSTTSDATGSYNRYGFHLGDTAFFDYPHLGVWPDGYYMSMNVFDPVGFVFLGPQPFAFDRAQMLVGNPATFVTTTAPMSGDDPFLPSDLDGSTLPPGGAPNSFVEWPGNGTYKVYHFHADFTTPLNSTFTLFASPAAAAFTQRTANIPEPNGANLDSLADRFMFRLAYRNLGSHESVVTNYTVDSGGVAGVRWIELRNVTSGPVTVFQESTYQPDATNRWMGSAAMDHDGNLAVGYSVSSSTVVPGLRYAGRLSTDPINTLAQGEATLFAGAGSQTGTSSRWGDYSDLTVDPVDDCTFWYTNEYYPAGSSSFNWRTRIGSFKFPSCVSPATLLSVVSRKTHGTVGTFEINLPLSGFPGIECRTGGPSGDHDVVFKFSAPVSFTATATCGGNSATVTSSGSEATVHCTGVPNAQTIPVALNSNAGNFLVQMGVLLGDTSNNGAVNSSDISQTKAQSGFAATSSNFRTDVNVNGLINSSDISLVKSKSGTALP